jgi:DNA-binding NarL/FixJ family response regulator
VQQLRVQRIRDAAELALGPSAASFFDEGRAMDLEAAVLYARTVQEAAARQPAPVAGLVSDGPLAWLTPREREVAALLLRGMSNRQIAEELVITERTAETHVCRILSKLGLGSRAQIAAWVMDHTPADNRPRVAV